VLQVGITLYNREGEPCSRLNETPELLASILSESEMTQPVPSTWNFNFHFDIEEAMCNDDLIAHLKSSGVDVARLATQGINAHDFASVLMSSGLVLDDTVTWVSFHGGYDFAFLVSALTAKDMPDVEQLYRDTQTLYFPHIYDVKYLIKHAAKDASNMEFFSKIDGRTNTLDTVAEGLKMKKVSPSQIAGSNSLITGKLFFTLRDKVYGGAIADEHKNQIFGLGNPKHIFKPATEFEDTSAATARTGENANGNGNGNPSTPNNATIGLASTPTPQNAMGRVAQGLMTPGGGGGVFGSFSFGQGPQQ
jgi:CCR4-NOT transcription complex subunit 7/8